MNNNENLTNREWLIKLSVVTSKMENRMAANIAELKQWVAMSKLIVLMGIVPPESIEADEKLLDIMVKEQAAMKKMSEAVMEITQLEILKEQAWKELADSKEDIIDVIKEKFPTDGDMLDKLQNCIDHMRGEEDED